MVCDRKSLIAISLGSSWLSIDSNLNPTSVRGIKIESYSAVVSALIPVCQAYVVVVCPEICLNVQTRPFQDGAPDHVGQVVDIAKTRSLMIDNASQVELLLHLLSNCGQRCFDFANVSGIDGRDSNGSIT